MKKWIVVFGVMLMCFYVKAHQPDLSSIMLIEQNKDQWIVQVRASLTAFEYEVEETYGKESYNTPEEFQQLVINHLKKNLIIKFNDLKDAELGNGSVKLGHETSVVFEILDSLKSIESVHVKNLSFKDISRSRSALIVLKEGFSKEQFILSDVNKHEVELQVGKLKFELKPTEIEAASPSYSLLLISGLVFFGLSGLIYFKDYDFLKKNSKSVHA